MLYEYKEVTSLVVSKVLEESGEKAEDGEEMVDRHQPLNELV